MDVRDSSHALKSILSAQVHVLSVWLAAVLALQGLEPPCGENRAKKAQLVEHTLCSLIGPYLVTSRWSLCSLLACFFSSRLGLCGPFGSVRMGLLKYSSSLPAIVSGTNRIRDTTSRMMHDLFRAVEQIPGHLTELRAVSCISHTQRWIVAHL